METINWNTLSFLEIQNLKIIEVLNLEQYSKLLKNQMTLSQLYTNYTYMDIPRALKVLFRTADVTLSDDERIINLSPNYFKELGYVLAKFSDRVIQNLFGFKYAEEKINGLDNALKEIGLEYVKGKSDVMEEVRHRTICFTLTLKYLWKGMSKQFVDKTFSTQAKNNVEEMVKNLKTAFRKILEEATWIGTVTKEAALLKLAAMKEKIGYPDTSFTDEDINQEYKNYTLQKDDFYANLDLAVKLAIMEHLASLRKSVNKNKWIEPPYVVNAHYRVITNEIIFPVGFLQSPAFSLTFPDSVNYGGIGTVIGHEITHGFDTDGSQFNEKGDFVNWWDSTDYKVYLDRAKCFIDQYSGFHFASINMSVNGTLTQDENIADDGGLRESFRAYKELVHKKGEQPKLPNLRLTQDQVFFLAFGQMWCSNVTRNGLISLINIDVHSPDKYRIIGTLQNSKDFAEAYKCPAGSYMNPLKKCSLW